MSTTERRLEFRGPQGNGFYLGMFGRVGTALGNGSRKGKGQKKAKGASLHNFYYMTNIAREKRGGLAYNVCTNYVN